MDWQGIGHVIEAIGKYGTPLVITAVVIVGAVAFILWMRGHVDRWLANQEVRREKDEARKDVLAEAVSKQAQTGEKLSDGIEVIANQAVKQTDLMVRMDARVEDHGRQLREHGAILSEFRTRFKGEEKRD